MSTDLFIKRIFSSASLNKLKSKVKLLGYDNNTNIYKFLNIKLIMLLLIFIFCFLSFNLGFMISPIVTFISYFLYDHVLLNVKIKKRSRLLEKEGIFYFEILALTMQSENNLKRCLERTCSVVESSLSNEFAFALKEVKVGKSLHEALVNLQSRIPSKSINNVILNIIEAVTYGNNITDTLQNQTVYLTDKRIMDIKSKINKMPTKISIISVIIFIPLILLLILGPVIIQYLFK